MSRCRLVTALLALLAAVPASAKEYHASRFDVRVEVLRGGSLRVTETIVFAFTEGTFREVFRTIPSGYSDGIEFEHASMDGRVLAAGEGPGTVRIRRGNGLRVDWRFAPVSRSSHAFELVYVARGVVRQSADADLLEWRALPSEHDYRIESASVEFALPDAPVRPPRIEVRRIEGRTSIVASETSVQVNASAVRRNGSLVVTVPLPRHSVLDAPPAWQARRNRQREQLPIWLAAAGIVTMIGFAVLFAARQQYDRPPQDSGLRWQSMLPPDEAPPAIAGALAANGRPQLEHAMATLVWLAERGAIEIREEPRGAFGARHFTIERVRHDTGLPAHEQAALEIAFEGSAHGGASVSLAKARALFARPGNWRRFSAAVRQELQDGDMLDAGRQAGRRRLRRIALAALMVGSAAAVGCAFVAGRFGPGPFLVPAALGVVALASFLMMASQTPLSNDGVRRAERWRAFRQHVARPQDVEPRWGASGTAESRMLPLAIALGAASAWAKYLKKRNVQTPGWFHAVSSLDSGHAFAAFVATGGAGAHGHSAGTAGGVAGGGASGAH